MKRPIESQLLVRGLNGRTTCLQLNSSTVRASELKAKLEVLHCVPSACQRIICGTKDIGEDGILSADASGNFPSCSVLLRLRGGKGGFGSLLRGSAKSGKHVENNDACRDLSGRRLRHVNAEKKLNTWADDEKEREIEKVAHAHLKKLQAQEKKEREDKEMENLFSKEVKDNEDKLAKSMEVGLMQAKMKRKELNATVNAQVKRQKFGWDLGDLSDSDSDDEDAEEGVGAGPSGAAAASGGAGMKTTTVAGDVKG
eukprot:CAMPEP_0197852768 /NCGR_PEP_ID=MMETSP1438-20131217/21333_1 /TAXON_ID=1461541 /ORGANISM="Pterosperma sp., Strain CCMP1384" /LENGTH=254 /DNA_ID=CAMNT_0043466937 /DNA_START=111 /DNA_END=872 /DNA_ORIENTATION=+